MPELLERAVSALTMYRPGDFTPDTVPISEDFYLRGVDPTPRQIQIIVRQEDGSLRYSWLAQYVEQRINEFLRLRDHWDGYRAREITDDAVRAAVQIIFETADDLTLPPQLFPLIDGGIQLEWHVGGEDLEIEIDAEGAAHALATDLDGNLLLDQEFSPSSQPTLREIGGIVRRISSRFTRAVT